MEKSGKKTGDHKNHGKMMQVEAADDAFMPITAPDLSFVKFTVQFLYIE